MRRIQLAIGAGVAAGLGAIAATIWVGASVREETVVAHPYEDGLRQDAERHARAALGLSVALDGAPDAGAAPLAFELRDRAGKPVDDAVVDVELSRPETSRGERGARAVSLGDGRWSADVAFPEAGPWDVRFDVVRGMDRVRLERRVGVRAACDLGSGPCARPLEGGGEVVVAVTPRPVRAMRELSVRVTVRGANATAAAGPTPTSTATATSPPTPPSTATPAAGPTPTPTATPTPGVSISFSMPGMTMGENRSTLVRTGPGAYEGTAVLVRCPTGRRDWIAEVEVAPPGAPPRMARFPLTVAEGGK